MQDSLSYIILVLIGVVIYLLVVQRKNKEEPKDNAQELNNLKESINNSFNTMSASFNKGNNKIYWRGRTDAFRGSLRYVTYLEDNIKKK